MTDHDRIIEQAAAWHAASSDDAMDWHGFTAWLEASRRHRTAYDEIALTDAAVCASREILGNATDATPMAPLRPRWRLAGAGGAMAAALVAIVAVPQLFRDPVTVYATQGASREIDFGGGTNVVLAPHSRLEARGGATRLALEGGAWFAVPHDPSRRLEIAAGPVTISDIGTRFDVQANGETVRLAVEEGEVSAASTAFDHALTVGPGQTLAFDGKSGTATVARIAPSATGSWRRNQLAYSDTPLALVVADLERYAGVHVAIPKTLRDRRFSGSLNIRDGAAAARDLAGLMGLALLADGNGYRLEPAGR